jgi:hypothetical protein
MFNIKKFIKEEVILKPSLVDLPNPEYLTLLLILLNEPLFQKFKSNCPL